MTTSRNFMLNITQSAITVMLVFGSTSVLSGNEAYIDFQSDSLITGKNIWLDSCEGCHAYGIADSPNPLVPRDWQHRISKDITILYEHAINGFFGPDDSMMPARGGNNSLSDQEVKLAVDYMVALAKFYINQEE